MRQLLYILFVIWLSGGCSSDRPPVVSVQIDELPDIYPDYVGVTIPATIAPLNFSVRGYGKVCTVFQTEGCLFSVYTSNGSLSIPDAKWKKLLAVGKGKQVDISVLVEDAGKWKAFRTFHIYVSADPIDPYIAYRLIDPGYQLWGSMGIYQRELCSFEQDPILENRLIFDREITRVL